MKMRAIGRIVVTQHDVGILFRENVRQPATLGRALMVNYAAAAVGVSERAMAPAIDQLFPAAPAPAAAAK